MPGFNRLKSETFEGGASELRRVIEKHFAIEATPVEREFDAKWALDLKDRVARGNAVTFLWAVAKLVLEGEAQWLRVNGQHSSWALHELLKAGALPDNLSIHLDTYSVEDADGAVQLFRQFDSRKSARSKEDISGAYQCFHENLKHCKRSVAMRSVEGMVWYVRELQKQPVLSGEDIYKMFNEERYHPFILMMDSIIDSKCNELKRVPIFAAAFGSWLADARAAAEFWKNVAAGSKRTAEDAATDLDVEILRLKDDKEKISAHDLYEKCAKAWFAYEDGIRVTSFRVNTRKKGATPIAA